MSNIVKIDSAVEAGARALRILGDGFLDPVPSMMKIKWFNTVEDPYFNFPLSTDTIIPFNVINYNEGESGVINYDIPNKLFYVTENGHYIIDVKLHFYDFVEGMHIQIKLFQRDEFENFGVVSLLYSDTIAAYSISRIFNGSNIHQLFTGSDYWIAVEIVDINGLKNPYPSEEFGTQCQLIIRRIN